MTKEARVLWTEGLFLSPQSFQQQERFLFNYIESRNRPIEPHYWGVLRLEYFQDKLDNGIVAIKHCLGIFPDGTPFDISDTILEVNVDQGTHDQFVYLGIGSRHERNQEVILGSDKQEKSTSRYIADELDVYDNQTIGAPNKKEVIMGGTLNLQLSVSPHPIDNFTQIAVARIKECDSKGVVRLDTSYIPPILYSLESPVIKDYVSQTQDQLSSRGKILANRLLNPSTSGVSDIIDFNLLLIINRYTPLFSYYIKEERTHPREIYTHALQLVGELATIAHEEKTPDVYPEYIHNDLQLTFGRLFQDIQQYLQYSTVPKALSIPLYIHEKYKTVYMSEHLSETVFTDHNRFVLSVSGDLSLTELQAKMKNITTLASTIDLLHQLVSSHTQGIPLIPQPSVPREIPYHANCVYLDLDTNSKHWKQVMKSRYVTAHIDSIIPGLKFELWAIRGKN